MTRRPATRRTGAYLRAGGLLLAAVLALLAVPAVHADANLSVVADQCSDLGCCFELGSSFEASVVAVANGDTLGAHRFDLLFDAGLLEVESVSGPSGGAFADVPPESCQSAPGVLTVGGLNCALNGAGTQELAMVGFRVIANGETQTTFGIGNEEVLSVGHDALQTSTSATTVHLLAQADDDCDLIPDADDNCPDAFNPDQNPDACAPLLVVLSRFEARNLVRDVVLISWETALEQDNAGFNLYRAPAPEGPWERINDNLIQARGSELEGAAYQYRDRAGRKGRVFYRLEDVDLSGQATSHGPLTVSLRPQGRPTGAKANTEKASRSGKGGAR